MNSCSCKKLVNRQVISVTLIIGRSGQFLHGMIWNNTAAWLNGLILSMFDAIVELTCPGIAGIH
ncbi:hypothetical protein D3C73_1528930 [compost metagenome]